MKDKKEKKRKDLVLRLNKIGADKTLILFDKFLSGTLKREMDNIIDWWYNEEFKEFVVYAEKNKKFIEVIEKY